MAVACTRVSAQDAELTRIKQNFSQLILPTETDEFHLNATLSSLSRTERGSDQVVVELFQRYPSDPDIIRTFLTTQTAEGTCPTSTTRTRSVRDGNHAYTRNVSWS